MILNTSNIRQKLEEVFDREISREVAVQIYNLLKIGQTSCMVGENGRYVHVIAPSSEIVIVGDFKKESITHNAIFETYKRLGKIVELGQKKEAKKMPKSLLKQARLKEPLSPFSLKQTKEWVRLKLFLTTK